jgi:hypothetical protein
MLPHWRPRCHRNDAAFSTNKQQLQDPERSYKNIYELMKDDDDYFLFQGQWVNNHGPYAMEAMENSEL